MDSSPLFRVIRFALGADALERRIEADLSSSSPTGARRIAVILLCAILDVLAFVLYCAILVAAYMAPFVAYSFLYSYVCASSYCY